MKADLHLHTTESDGRLRREELFQLAKSRQIDVIAITDHDVCRHVEDNHRLAKQSGVQYIPGIELSTLYEGKSVHVLGYFRSEGYKSDIMEQFYIETKARRERRAHTFVANLAHYFNLHITYEDIVSVSHGIIARPHIAKAIRMRYPQYSHNEIFDLFIGEHTKAYVPSTEIELSEGIALLRTHDALVVLAHPTLLKPAIHDAVLEHDFDGIEAIYGLNRAKETERYCAFAKERGLLVTAGSDFHGIENDTKHKELGEITLQGDALKRFLTAVNVKKK